jgi:hypothetical protein
MKKSRSQKAEQSAAAAPTEKRAVEILIRAGYPKECAVEIAAIMFGKSNGDLIVS